MLRRIIHILFNTRAAGIYLLIFAISIGVATFIENDFGTSSAQKVVYQTRWFELLLILFSGSLVYNIIQFRMIQQRKWALFTFHVAMIIILIGAGVTRYFGYEGMMHIREGEQSNTFLSAEPYLKFEVTDGSNHYVFEEEVLFATLGNNKFKQSYQLGQHLISAEVKAFVPNPKQIMVSNEGGRPILKVVIAGMNGREEYFITPGDRTTIRNIRFNFSNTFIPGAINIKYEKDQLWIKASQTLTQMVMATQQRDTLYPRDSYYPLQLRSLYSDGINNFVFGDFNSSAQLDLISEHQKMKNESLAAIQLEISVDGEQKDITIYGQKGSPGRAAIETFGQTQVAVAYGSKNVQLPFSILLYDFIMERYPGTNSAASYASEVQLIDPSHQVKMDYRIFMNHILNHGGYRFFQSSFDQDEKGTYLSVNHDFWGTWISYLGYALLTVGMILIFFNAKSRFTQVSKKLQSMQSLILIACMFTASIVLGQKTIHAKLPAVSEDHAKMFSRVIVQDHKGRMKPVHTLTREVLRKISRKESIQGLNADQVVLSMYAQKSSWLGIPLIKTSKHERIQELIGVDGKLAAYKDFFHTDGSYKLQEEVRRAYSLQPIDRGIYEKDLMKIDERVNIVSMIFSGRLFKVVPIPEDPNNTWVSTDVFHSRTQNHVPVAERFFEAYQPALDQAIKDSDYTFVNQLISELTAYQKEKGGSIVPSTFKRNAEIFLNQLNVFSRLSWYYTLLGLVFLILLFVRIFKPEFNHKNIMKILFGLALLGFLFHTLGLGIRWYVSGRAPWSNGYESMIYIGWTTTLAGLIFTRKSLGGLAATMILAGTILLVAMLSYLDPEITPLVPVLRSYWLTIHVSLIAGSYGFLMLGAIIGLINLILMGMLTNKNKHRIKRIVTEMTHISELTLMGGLIMISIGTYLGGVWANESWGRYWGWDAKETWALVTILIYAFILHMRIIPKLYSLYRYNLATLFGWASVIMTYFGVNYYLSGLHSYAAGDPVPIPTWVYFAVSGVAIISIVAYFRHRKVGFRSTSIQPIKKT